MNYQQSHTGDISYLLFTPWLQNFFFFFLVTEYFLMIVWQLLFFFVHWHRGNIKFRLILKLYFRKRIYMNMKNSIDNIKLMQTLACINFGGMYVNYFQAMLCLDVCCFIFYSLFPWFINSFGMVSSVLYFSSAIMCPLWFSLPH